MSGEANHDAASIDVCSGTAAAVLDCLATQLVAGLEAGLQPRSAEDVGDTTSGQFICILGGHPSDYDIAALIAVFAADASPQNMPQSPMISLGDWGNPTDQLRYGLGSAPAHFVNAHFTR